MQGASHFKRAALLACLSTTALACAQTGFDVKVDWSKTLLVSRTTPTLQVVVNPPLRHGQPLSAASYKALKALGADYVRYVPWLPYPKLAVAELEPPTKDRTSWDFSQIDPMTNDFLEATDGHPTIVNFSTMPAWLFKTEKSVPYPSDPLQRRSPRGKPQFCVVVSEAMRPRAASRPELRARL